MCIAVVREALLPICRRSFQLDLLTSSLKSFPFAANFCSHPLHSLVIEADNSAMASLEDIADVDEGNAANSMAVSTRSSIYANIR